MSYERKTLGVAVIGAGRMGTHRARMAANHPAVRFLAISDADPARAKALGEQVGAHFTTGSNEEAISHPDVTAVIVSTPEPKHVDPILQTIERGKSVVVETPLALTLDDADRLIEASARSGVELHVNYSKRYQRHYFLAKEQVLEGRLGRILGGTARVYNSRAQAFEILKRTDEVTPVVDVLVYSVDMICWLMEGIRPVEVFARGHGVVFEEAGYPKVNDTTWAILTFEDGAVFSLGICYALPSKYPTLGQGTRLEIIGKEGVLLFDEDKKENLLYTEKGYPHVYVPDHHINTAFWEPTPPAIGRLIICSGPSPTRRAPGSITFRQGILACIRPPKKRGGLWKLPSQLTNPPEPEGRLSCPRESSENSPLRMWRPSCHTRYAFREGRGWRRLLCAMMPEIIGSNASSPGLPPFHCPVTCARRDFAPL